MTCDFQEREDVKLLRSQLQEARQKHDIAVARLKAELKEGRDEIAQLRDSDNILRRQLQEGGKRYADLEKAMTTLQVALQDTGNKLAKIEQSKQALSVELNQKVKTASQERDDAITRGEAADESSERLNKVCLLCPYPAALLSEFFSRRYPTRRPTPFA